MKNILVISLFSIFILGCNFFNHTANYWETNNGNFYKYSEQVKISNNKKELFFQEIVNCFSDSTLNKGLVVMDSSELNVKFFKLDNNLYYEYNGISKNKREIRSYINGLIEDWDCKMDSNSY